MRHICLAALVVALSSIPSLADGPPAPPADATPLKLHEGESKAIPTRNGAQAVCDDPAVAHSEIRDDGLVLVGGSVGQTLCGVRFAGANRALYAVTVVKADQKK
jgi:hypothetical protein